MSALLLLMSSYRPKVFKSPMADWRIEEARGLT